MRNPFHLLTSSRCPYSEGKILNLRPAGRCHLQTDNDGLISCRIANFFQPSTLSCAMEVELLDGTHKRAVLKLFNHRFATQFRSEEGAGPWTTATADAFKNFVESGEAAEFLPQCKHRNYLDESQEDWPTAKIETFLYAKCLEMYRAEAAAYWRLSPLEGREVPEFLAQVSLQTPTSPVQYKPPPTTHFFTVMGILLEFIDGYKLSNVATHAAREDWDMICWEAVRVVRLVDDYEILNNDVRPGNVLVCHRLIPGSWTNMYRVVMLDFGLSKLRSEEWDHQ